MTKRGNSPFLHFLLLLAFITAGISPACQFISGKTNLIEICTSDGLKMVSVPGDEAPSHEHKKADQCAFCFTSANAKTVKATPIEIAFLSKPAQQLLNLADAQIIQQENSSNYIPRGPPILL